MTMKATQQNKTPAEPTSQAKEPAKEPTMIPNPPKPETYPTLGRDVVVRADIFDDWRAGKIVAIRDDRPDMRMDEVTAPMVDVIVFNPEPYQPLMERVTIPFVKWQLVHDAMQSPYMSAQYPDTLEEDD